MSFLKKQHSELERKYGLSDEKMEKKERKCDELRESLCRLIEDTKKVLNLPEGAEELLYEFSSGDSESELALIKNLKETYVLTNEGIKKAWVLRRGGDLLSKLTVRKLEARELVFDYTDPQLFDKICDNMQIIKEKYGMEIDEKKYLIEL